MEHPLILVLLAVARAADLTVPADQDPLGWARAWTEVVHALQDGSLLDARLVWARAPGGWTCTLAHGGRVARLDGLAPAASHEERVAQLYVLIGLLAPPVKPSLGALLAPPPAAPPPPGPPPARGSEPPPLAVAPVVEAREPPPVPVPDVTVSLDIAAAEEPPRPTFALFAGADTDAAVQLGAEVGGDVGRWRVAGRVSGGYDPAVGGFSELRAARADALGLVERPIAPVAVGIGLGASLRAVYTRPFDLGAGVVPTARVHVGLELPWVRPEVAFVHDLRQVRVFAADLPSLVLPADRAELLVHVRLGAQ